MLAPSIPRRQLTRRFGPLLQDVLYRFALADFQQLEAWADRVIDAASLDEIFARDCPHRSRRRPLQVVCHGPLARVLLWAKLAGNPYVEATVAQAACVERNTVPCLTLARPIEVLLVDDQRAILAGVTALIESEGPDLHVAGRATTGRQALELAASAQPDVIVLDVDLGGEDGLMLIPGLLSASGAAIIVFTCLIDPAARHRAAHLGAAGFIQKTALGTELIAAIRRATDSVDEIDTD